MSSMPPEKLLEDLTEPQRKAVVHTTGPLLVIAGPGSGKTRVITRRAAYLAQTVTTPDHVLAITFTNKAANEMLERIRALGAGRGITCSTFHAFCARLLRQYADRAGLLPNFTIYDMPDQLAAMKAAIEEADLSADHFVPARILERISRIKNEMISPDQFAEQANDFQARAVAEAYSVYQQKLQQQNAVDFDDLLIRATHLLADDQDLRDRLQERFQFVLIDEYQDTNHAQYLLARGLALGHENLCVTGDPDQSIYAWRGANLHNILDFEQDFPDAVVVHLEQNYRSTPQVLAAADALISHNRKRKLKALWTDNTTGPAVRVVECEHQQAEADYIADAIRQHAEAGGRYADVAVFYRINALSRNIEAAMRNHQIPYQIARGVAFYQRKEIKDLVAYLKVIANPLDEVALLRIINTPTRGIGDTTVDRLLSYARSRQISLIDAVRQHEQVPNISRARKHLDSFVRLLDDLTEVARTSSVHDMIEHAALHSGLRASWHQAEDGDASANADELINAAAEYDRHQLDATGNLQNWLEQVSLVADVDAVDPVVGAVTLMTLHAAKGLEFDTVFIAGVEDGLLPHRRNDTDTPDIEEERRLCFVGMTRARRQLTLTSARWRDFRGTTRRTSRSLFVTELPADQIDVQRVGESGRNGYDTARDWPASSVEYLDWRRGQLVRHPEYGIGRLMWIQPRGKGTYAGINFSAYGTKTLVLEYANVELVETDEW